MKKIYHVCSLNFKGAGGIKKSIPTLSYYINNFTKCDSFCIFSFKDFFNIKKENGSYFIIHSSFQLLHLLLIFSIPKGKVFWVPRGSLNSSFISYKKNVFVKFFMFIVNFRSLDLCMIYLNESEQINSCLDVNYKIIPNGIEPKLDLIPNIHQRYINKKIVFLSRFDVHQKGIDRIYFLLNNTDIFSNFEILLFGATNQKDLNLVQDMFSDFKNVHCFLSITDDEIIEVMKDATYHILLSRCEGMPMSCLEALSFAVPQLVSEETNILPEIIDSNCGFDYSNFPIKKLTDLQFVDYEKMCINSLLLSKQYDWKVIAKRFSSL